MTDTQPHGFPLCSCHFMFLSAACKASPALWLCGCWSDGAGAQVRTDTPHAWKHTLSSELRKELRNSLLGRQIAAPCLQRCLDLCFLRQPAPLGKISGQISLKSSRHSFCEPTERELQKTIFTKQTHTALNMNYKQQFSRYNPTREMFPHSTLYACCNTVKLPNCRVQKCSFWNLKIHTSMYTKEMVLLW